MNASENGIAGVFDHLVRRVKKSLEMVWFEIFETWNDELGFRCDVVFLNTERLSLALEAGFENWVGASPISPCEGENFVLYSGRG